MISYIKFGPAVCQLQDFLNHQLWNTWQWKLDSFRIPYSEQITNFLKIESVNNCMEVCLDGECLQIEDSGFYQKQVLQANDEGTIWQMVNRKDQIPLMKYAINKEWSHIKLLEDHTKSAGHVAFEYMGNMVSYALIKQNVITFHGVLMEYEGKGIIISAASGIGKTTHARLWRDNKGSFIINGDKASCWKKNGRWTGFGMPWCGTSGEFMNRSAPITALVILERDSKNTCERLNVYEGFQMSLPHVQCPTWDRDISGLALNLLDDFLKEIPVIKLKCLPDVESVEVLKQELEKIWQ